MKTAIATLALISGFSFYSAFAADTTNPGVSLTVSKDTSMASVTEVPDASKAVADFTGSWLQDPTLLTEIKPDGSVILSINRSYEKFVLKGKWEKLGDNRVNIAVKGSNIPNLYDYQLRFEFGALGKKKLVAVSAFDSQERHEWKRPIPKFLEEFKRQMKNDRKA